MNTKDPRAALTALIAALERHYDVIAATNGEDEDQLDVATERLSMAFENYDDALFDAYSVATPFIIFDDEDDDYDDDDDFDDFDDLDLDEDDYDDEDDED
ncbi:DNA primase [Dermabacter vaginalis]|uniref:DNA primase n=1 Tax=Dermabacter vaginalis TaxID=1630135 RepID=A0A1B0ZIE7_9MICO|nr:MULTISPECIES: DNA primase [Dermabacter]SHV73884.1 Uncharacterised protein [Mycobacteroides abscessus subsp. abscessus]ANP27622.1 hypothetical protein DAD186_10720 [Dermabacter vaginalis]MCG7442613.1 DNA primase [Dermabacter vaginalis]MCT2149717.1 DNA primase [Dermabacter vaginalis]QEU11962.1 DNA primase [Dermabacter vaginalis]